MQRRNFLKLLGILPFGIKGISNLHSSTPKIPIPVAPGHYHATRIWGIAQEPIEAGSVVYRLANGNIIHGQLPRSIEMPRLMGYTQTSALPGQCVAIQMERPQNLKQTIEFLQLKKKI